MNHAALGPGNRGFAGVAILVGVAVLSFTGIYVANQSQMSKHTVDRAQIDRARSTTELSNLSSLARVRSLMAGKMYGTALDVGIYPKNYFESPWVLEKNEVPESTPPLVEVQDNRIWLNALPKGGMTASLAQSVLTEDKSQIELMKLNTQELQLVRTNPNAEHLMYIESIDVATRRILDSDKIAGGENREMETIGRISLEAPVPKEARLLVKFPGTSEFTENWGDPDTVHPAGEYQFQMRASGIVFYGEVIIDGISVQVGRNPSTGAVTHKAYNIKAVDEVIGEFTHTIGRTASYSDAEVVIDTECRLAVEPSSTGSAGSASTIVMRVHGVSQEAVELSKTYKLSTQDALGTVAEAPAGPACEDRCPYSFKYDFWSEPLVRAGFLDLAVLGESDATKLDYNEPDFTALITNKARGIICSNMELVGQAMAAEGKKKPTELLSATPTLYESLLSKNMGLKRFFAYTAPSCQRQLVGQRTACGCFAEDTMIQMEDGSARMIRDLRQGDRVFNPKTGLSQSIARVIAGPEKVPMYRIFAGERSVLVTSQHPFLLDRGMTAAKDLRIGDVILGNGDFGESIQAIESVSWDGKSEAPVVWNLELEGSFSFEDHYVLANGIMTGDLFIQESLANKK